MATTQTADYPTALHTVIAATSDASEFLGATAPTHTEMHEKLEKEVYETQLKLGTGASPAGSAAADSVLIKGLYDTEWGILTTDQITEGTNEFSKWANVSGDYDAITQIIPGRRIFASGGSNAASAIPYAVSGIAPNYNFTTDFGSGGGALNIFGLSAHGDGGFDFGSLLFFNRSRGSITSPEALQSGDALGGMVAGGFDGSAYTLTFNGFNLSVDGAVSPGVVPIRADLQIGTSAAETWRADGRHYVNISTAGSYGLWTNFNTSYVGLNIVASYTPENPVNFGRPEAADTDVLYLAGSFGYATTSTVMAVQGMQTHTGNLQEWQDYQATVLTFVNSAGRVVAPTIGIRTGTSAAVGYLDILSNSYTIPSINFRSSNITGAGNSGYNISLGEDGDYAGYLKFYAQGTAQDAWALALVSTLTGVGASSTGFFSAPTYKTVINGRGDSDILKWTNDASNNFSGTADVGQSYAFGGAPASFSKLNAWIGSTATSTFNVVRHTDTANLFSIVGSTGNATFYPGVVAQATIGDPTASPYAVLELMPTDRNTASSATGVQNHILVNNTYTTTAANAIAPIGYNYGPTVIFGTDGYGFGSGSLFYSHALIQNNSGSTRNIGPVTGFIEQSTLQANGGTFTENYYAGFLCQPVFNRINSGTMIVTSASAFYSNGATIGAGTTVTDYGHFTTTNIANSGTLTNQIGLDIAALQAGTNNYGVRSAMAVSGTSRYHLYLSGTALSYIQGSVGIGVADPAEKLEITGNLTFTEETARTISLQDTVTAATAGAQFNITGAAGSNTTSGAGGAVVITAGAGRQGNSGGGALTLVGGVGVGVSGGGNVNITGGAALTGGTVILNGGNGVADGNVRLVATDGMVQVGHSTAPVAMMDIQGKIAATPVLNVDNLAISASIAIFKDNGTAVWTIADGGALTAGEAVNIIFGTTTGTKIGTATTQKLAFYNATPIVQGASVADATGGATVDAEARTAINALISRIEATGLIATV